MPIYEYSCLDCGTQFETIRSMKDADTVIRCKECESRNTKRRLSVFAAHSEGGIVAGCGGGVCDGEGGCGGNCGCGHSHNS